MCVVYLGTEDELSEAIGLRLLSELDIDDLHIERLRKNGNGYLRSRITSFVEIARRYPFLLITDLDSSVCPLSLIQTWMGTIARPNNLLFRVATREIESWLLADHDGIRSLLGDRSTGNLPRNPDLLDDPKREFLARANRAPREIRNDLVTIEGSISSQGLGYNQRLSQFVEVGWSPRRAATRSDSLQRTRNRLRQFVEEVCRS